jgi:hypothetical protein
VEDLQDIEDFEFFGYMGILEVTYPPIYEVSKHDGAKKFP